jgi:hypothetical protein
MNTRVDKIKAELPLDVCIILNLRLNAKHTGLGSTLPLDFIHQAKQDGWRNGLVISNKLHPRRLMACKYNPLETPRGRYDEHSSKFPSVVKPRLNRTSRRKPNFRR